MDYEGWRAIAGWDGQYWVSTWGRVWSRPQRRQVGGLLSQMVRDKGYLAVDLWAPGHVRARPKVHKLVLEAFVGLRPVGQLCRHLDGEPANNVVWNLCWGTPKENAADRLAHGRDAQRRKTHCPQDHPYDEVNTYWTVGGHRACRECRRAWQRRNYAVVG